MTEISLLPTIMAQRRQGSENGHSPARFQSFWLGSGHGIAIEEIFGFPSKIVFSNLISRKIFLIAAKQIRFYDAMLSRKDNNL
ncbi:MAG: hypothetical protein ACYDB0_05800 [Acidithiobacillus sp.]